MSKTAESTYSFRTAWSRSLQAPLRDFLRTETGSASFLLAGTLVALAWANIDAASYDSVWGTELSIRVGDSGISQDFREWINSGLMAFFFFVVGLEARREFDVGELRERRRLALPLLAAIGGMALPVCIYLALNAGHGTAAGWGAAMSTDTAFALGLLALVGPRFPDRLRAFLLTIALVDDVIALLVIAFVYSEAIAVTALLIALGIFAVILAVRAVRVRVGLVYGALGAAAWVALLESGVDPVVLGLAMGLLTYAYPAARDQLEQATERFLRFREQPTPALARSAREGVRSAVSPNARLLQLYHPWTGYFVVPLFALANAGVSLERGVLAAPGAGAVLGGVLAARVLGKLAGITAATWLAVRLGLAPRPEATTWPQLAGVATVAGIGFTVPLFVADLAFPDGRFQAPIKLGLLLASVLCGTAGALVLLRTARRAPPRAG
jgi:Na+/H+ antiporter NhaA